MSQTKKKKMKQPTRLRTLVASLMLITPAIHAANNTEFSSLPLVGVAASFAPHIALALSVEYPTAGAAYSETTEFSFTANSHKEEYKGYFDNKKCYIYKADTGAFYPSSKATGDKTTGLGQCNNGRTDEFSGNLLNFMTMSAVDIFRSTMTGGNRAMGTDSELNNYQSADTDKATYLRRARVFKDQNARNEHRLSIRRLIIGNNTEIAKKYIPVKYVAENKPLTTPSQMGLVASTFAYGAYHSSNPIYGSNGRKVSESISVGRPVGRLDEFVHPDGNSNDIIFRNSDFGFNLEQGRYEIYKNVDRNEEDRRQWGYPSRSIHLFTDGTYHWEEGRVRATYFAAPAGGGANDNFNVVVRVCDANVGLEDNCKAYGSNFKPEGLLQKYTVNNKMRFATFGYLNINSNDIHGGVLRSRMKLLLNDAEESKGGDTFAAVYGDEWDVSTGQLKPNPDTTDAQNSNVNNSGTINYLNKFGDKSGYKTRDPAAELYHTALTYLQGTNVGKGIYKVSSDKLTTEAVDGFPVIYDWDDPYKRGIDPKVQHCHANSIIFIGDTNTHHDGDVESTTLQDLKKVQDYTKRLFGNETGLSSLAATENFGYESAPAYMAGLAYWARTNNIRPDLKHTQERPINGSNFLVDVVENGDYKNKPMRNAYYLAAKYGGFDIAPEKKVEVLVTKTSVDDKVLPTDRTTWTDDLTGSTSLSAFDGVPRNFAIANRPDAMIKALENAMESSAALNNPSQAATGLSIGLGEILDVSADGSNHLLQSTYDFVNLTGDVVVYKPVFKEEKNKETGVVERNFELTQVARTGSILTSTYHGSNSKYTGRKVFTIKDNKPYEFIPTNANNIFAGIEVSKSGMSDADASTNLLKYVLGDSSLEGVLRKRNGLQGTVINSTATPIFAAKNISGCAAFDAKATSRPTYYAAAANDGMLHIFNRTGSEAMAYMAGTALEKLPEFAKIGFQHQYLNDGTPVIQDVCLNSKPTTVLLGSTGRGGQAVYALDVTDISSPSTKNLMWEFSNKDDKDLGLTVAKPIITKGANGKQYAIVSSGYHTDGTAADNGYIFILDIGKTGSWSLNNNYWKVQLGRAGVGAPFVYDSDSDGIGDKIFVGDEEGKVWQLDRPESGDKPFELKYNAALFTPNSTFARPITGAPFADMVNGKLMVTVGTGRYFSEKDLGVTQQNYAYGLIVNDKTPIEDNSTNILEQNFTTEKVENKLKNANVYAVTDKKMSEQHQGWRLTLVQGMNIAAPSLIRQRQVSHFVFARNTGEINSVCVRGANAGIIEVDVKTGGLFSKPLIDTDGDGQFTEKDAPNAAALEFVGMNTSVGTFLQYRNPNSNINVSAVYFNDGSRPGDGTGGGPRLVDLRDLSETKAGVRRISWREIF